MRKDRITCFFEKIKQSKIGGCWIWEGASVMSWVRYGQIWNGKKNVLDHRFSYQYFVGEIPKGMTIDHQCNNGLCVNPFHLKPMSLKENILKSEKSPSALNARKTHCLFGHPYDLKNTKRLKSGRACRTCVKKWNIIYNKKRKKQHEADIRTA